jgi:hypothetical protein
MSKEVDHQISRLCGGPNNPLTALKRLLSITAINVLFEPVEHLLNIYPDVSSSQPG